MTQEDEEQKGKCLRDERAEGGLAPTLCQEEERGGKSSSKVGKSLEATPGVGSMNDLTEPFRVKPVEANLRVRPAALENAGMNSVSGALTAALEFHKDHEKAEVPLRLSGQRFSEMGDPLCHALQPILWSRHCKTMSMAKDRLYPLPLVGYEGIPPDMHSWCKALILGLNSLAGADQPADGRPTEVQKKMVLGLMPLLRRMMDFEDVVPSTSLSELFLTKSIDYRGEEIKLAKAFNWRSIEGALPLEVGTLELSQFVTGGCHHFVTHFEEYLLPEGKQSLERTPAVRVSDEDWPEVCQGLIQRGICEVFPYSQLHHIDGKALVNGMFSVSKNEFQGSVELHRLIMNLIPLNRVSKSLRGDVHTLPSIAGFSAFYLEDGQVAIMAIVRM